jgi:heterodisulfide reductase subunit C
MVLLGLKQEVLESSTIWLCASCYLCNERCLKALKISNVFFALKNIAAQHHIIPKGIKQLTENLLNLGVTAEVTEFQAEEREDLGLPEVPKVDSSTIREILCRTGLYKLVGKEERVQEEKE